MDDVYRFARSLTRHEQDAQDLVQETFLRAYRSWRTFEAGSDCRRWLFTVCRRAYLRSRERVDTREAHEVGDADGLPAVLMHADAVRDGTDDILTRLDLGPALRRALGTLGEPFRAAVVLVDGSGFSYQEAGEILSVPVGTVRSRLFRGRRMLQELLFAHAHDLGFARRDIPAGATDDER